MGIKVYRPYTDSRRHMTGFDFEEITKSKPEKALTKRLKSGSGHNNHGQITIRHKGGGHKRRYRMIDFKRDILEIPAKVAAIEYDPYRTARIALLFYKNGKKTYILAPVGLNVGDTVISSKTADIKPGNCLRLADIPAGTVIHNIEMRPGKGAQLVRGAGAGASLAGREGDYCQIRMPSGEIRKVHGDCRATIGQVGNTDNENITIGKAGRSRWLNIRPFVRGTAMNPIDHPMGGGEARGKGNHPMTPWGKGCKGSKTRHNKRTDMMIIRRRK